MHVMRSVKVKDATSAVANVDDYNGSAQLLAATTLRFLDFKDGIPSTLSCLSVVSNCCP